MYVYTYIYIQIYIYIYIYKYGTTCVTRDKSARTDPRWCDLFTSGSKTVRHLFPSGTKIRPSSTTPWYKSRP